MFCDMTSDISPDMLLVTKGGRRGGHWGHAPSPLLMIKEGANISFAPFLWLTYDLFSLCNQLYVQINFERDLFAATAEPKFGQYGSNVGATPWSL